MTNIYEDMFSDELEKTVGQLLTNVKTKPLQGTIFEDYKAPLPEGTEVDATGKPTGPYGGAFLGPEISIDSPEGAADTMLDRKQQAPWFTNLPEQDKQAVLRTLGDVITYQDDPQKFIDETAVGAPFAAGTGDVINTIGTIAKVAGLDNTGDAISNYGKDMSNQFTNPRELVNLGEFKGSDIYNPDFYYHKILRSVPYSLSLIPASVAAGYAGSSAAGYAGLGTFGKLLVGSITAGVTSRSLESLMEGAGAYNEAKAKGMDDEEAERIFWDTAKKNASLVGLDVAEFMLAFAPGISVSKKIIGEAMMGSAEEVFQHKFTTESLGEEFNIGSPETKESAFSGAVFGVAMGGAGAMFTGMKNDVVNGLPEDIQEEYYSNVDKFVKEGDEQDVAEVRAIDVIAKNHEPVMRKVISTIVDNLKKIKDDTTGSTRLFEDIESDGEQQGERINQPDAADVGRAEAEEQQREAIRQENIRSELSQFTDDDTKLFDKIRRYKNTTYADGDIETMRKNPTWQAQIERAIERYNEATGKELVDTEAFEEIMNLPSLSDERVANKKSRFAKSEGSILKQNIEEAHMVKKPSRKDKVNQVKNAIIDYAKRTLAKKDLGEMLNTVKSAENMTDFINAVDMIDRIATKSKRRDLKINIRKKLGETKAKRPSGKPVGKYTPEIQNVLDIMRETVKLNRKTATEKANTNIRMQKGSMVPIGVALENKILSMWDGSVSELETFMDIVDNLIDKGSLSNALKKFNLEAEMQADRDFAEKRITGGKGITPGRETSGKKRTFKNSIKKILKSLGHSWVFDWHGEMQTIDSNNPVGDSELSKVFGTLSQDNAYKNDEFNFVIRLNDAIKDIYKTKGKGKISDWHKFHKKLEELSKIVSLGKFKNLDGVQVEIRMSKDEIIKRWMEFKDPSLRDSFILGNKYTDEIFTAIEEEMTPEDKKFAEWQLKEYRDQWERIRPIYNEMYGVDLPFNEFYSPIRREGYKIDETKGFGEFLVEADDRRSTASGAFIGRVENFLPIASVGSVDVMMRHMKETNYFIAWAKQIRRFNYVFGDANVREAISQEFGQGILNSIDHTIKDLTSNGNTSARANSLMSFMRKGYTIGALAVKPAVGIKQLVSTLAYLEKVGPVDFMAGLVDFLRHPVQATKILDKESVLIKTRGENIERDIKAAINTEEFRKLKRIPSIQNLLMFNVKLGDKAAILMGSWAIRKARLKKNIPLADIIHEYENFSAETQQSSDISRLSQIQRGSPLEQLFTMFKSSQRQYLAKELNAIKSLFRKDGFTKKNIKHVAKIMMIYHVTLPVIFQYIANLGGWDDEDKKDYLRAMMLGSINGVFIFGDIVDSVIREALGLRVWDNEIPLMGMADPLIKAMKELKEEDFGIDTLYNAMSELIEAGNSIGIPVSQTKNFVGGIADMMDNTVRRGIARILGWSEYRVEKRFDDTGGASGGSGSDLDFGADSDLDFGSDMDLDFGSDMDLDF